MSIEKWHPLSDLEHMRREMERMWEEAFPTPRRSILSTPWRRLAGEEGVSIPPLDIIEKDDELLVKLEMPGVMKENLDVSSSEGVLTIKGKVEEEKEVKDEQYIRKERAYTSFARSISIPNDIDSEKIHAELEHGILTVHLPRTEEKRSKKILVEVK